MKHDDECGVRIEYYDTDTDYPDWRDYGEYFRSPEKAQAQCDELRAGDLAIQNRRAESVHMINVQRIRENNALVDAGLRQASKLPDPGEFQPRTDLPNTYRVVPIEWMDAEEVPDVNH